MGGATMETLLRRLDRLERENRRLKRAGILVLAVIAAVALMGVHEPPTEIHDVVEAKRFVVRDKSGNHWGLMVYRASPFGVRTQKLTS